MPRDDERLFLVGRTWHTWVYVDIGKGKFKRVKRTTKCRSKVAARVVAAQLEQAAANPASVAQAAYTLEEALFDVTQKKREDAKAGKKSVATVEFYLAKSKVIVSILGNHLPLTSLGDTAAVLEGYVSKRRQGDTQDTTIYKEMVVIRSALKWARKRGKWSGDLAAVLPELSNNYKPRKRWSRPAQLNVLLGELGADNAARAAFIVATSAELGATDRAKDDDVTMRMVHLRGTKRETRLRDVPIVTTWQRALLEYSLQYARGRAGKMFAHGPEEFRSSLRYACRRAGLPHLSPNDLRRTCSTWLRAAGARLENIAPLMGHADTRMLERVYDGTTPEQLGTLLSLDLGLDTVWTDAAEPAATNEIGETSEPRNYSVLVPGTGIEPVTRGFSIRLIPLQHQCFRHFKTGQVATMNQWLRAPMDNYKVRPLVATAAA